MEYSLEHSDVLGIQLRPKGQDPNERGDMQIRRSAGGRNRVVDVNSAFGPRDRADCVPDWRVRVRTSGGSMDAEFTVSSSVSSRSTVNNAPNNSAPAGIDRFGSLATY